MSTIKKAEEYLDKYFIEEWNIKDKSQRDRLSERLATRIFLAGQLTNRLIFNREDSPEIKRINKEAIEDLLK